VLWDLVHLHQEVEVVVPAQEVLPQEQQVVAVEVAAQTVR